MPSLVVFNPPKGRAPLRVRRMLASGNKFAGIISAEVMEIRYRHIDDGELYEHDFETLPDVDMFAIEGPDGSHCVLLMGSEGQSLWEEFE